MGTAVINLIQIQPDEKITATVPSAICHCEGYLMMGPSAGDKAHHGRRVCQLVRTAY